ncbi:MAG: hypothetical protein U1E76_01335 [Planctomycetota bacterium]
MCRCVCRRRRARSPSSWCATSCSASCASDDLAARAVEPITLIEELGRYRYLTQTEVTAPIIKMIRNGNEDRACVVFLPGTRLMARVQLEPRSRLELNATWVVPASLSGPFGDAQELLVRARAASPVSR